MESKIVPESSGYTFTLDSPSSDNASSPSYRDTALPFSGSSYRPPKDNVPARIREMHRLFDYSYQSDEVKARNFYKQARLMEDYEDNFPWKGEFLQYFPCYSDMNTSQLRGYFTWRAQLRKGNFQYISASAAYIYIYELLNCIGADDPADALKKLKEFRDGFLASDYGDERMLPNLNRWMIEYAVINNIPAEIAQPYLDSKIITADKMLSALMSPDNYDDETVFSALCTYGGKKTAESPVITQFGERGRHLFCRAWRLALSHQFGGKALIEICFGEKSVRHWYPLANAVYYDRTDKADRDYQLDACRSYRRVNGVWYTFFYDKNYFDTSPLKSFLHETDVKLRRYFALKRYLKEKPGDEWADPYINAAIEEDRLAAIEAARPKISIDLSDLDKIRLDAAGTRDSLLTEDEMREDSYDPAPAIQPGDNSSESDECSLPLDGVYIRILRALLTIGNASDILKSEHLMPSIAADTINEALYDFIGDMAVICEDNTLIPVEDYIEDLTQLLGGNSNG